MNQEFEDQPGQFAPIVQLLEAQLPSLDALGAHIAAAHVDAAINQLRIDEVKSRHR